MNATSWLQRHVYFRKNAQNDVTCEQLLVWDSHHPLVLGVCMSAGLKMAGFAEASLFDRQNCQQTLELNV